jgi:predicted transcriptional regulator
MNERAAEYRGKLDELRRRGGRRWRAPEALREEIAAWASELRSGGYTLSAIAAAVGLSESTMGRWLLPREGTGQLRRVRVAAAPGHGVDRGLVVVTPTGYRLEGLAVDEAVEVLRRL